MKFLISLIWFYAFSISWLYGQSDYKITGQLNDTVTFSVPSNAYVVLTENKDTIAKTHADNSARFYISIHNAGRYLLQISHPNYITYTDSIIASKIADVNLGFIQLHLKSKLLDEVVIHDNPTVSIKGDTTEFTADSFLVRQFSSAKELLSKIPGIQIDLEGHISYNGKPIDEVSLDGVPFLSMGPDKLLSLLRGKDLNKVQLFDLKSRQSRLTGNDDGSRNAGLNLTLKQEAKTGYYGKLAGGLGASKSAQWDNSGNLNSFNDKRRVLLFTNLNNTGGTSAMGETTMPQQSASPQGKPQNVSGGAHYDTRLLKDNKLSVNLDYLFNSNAQNSSSLSNTTNLIPGDGFKTTELSSNISNNNMHNLNVASTYKLSNTSNLNFILSSNINSGKNNSKSQSESNSLDDTILNKSITQNNSTLHSPNTMANVSYQKTFDKAGRAFNASFTSSFSTSKMNIEQVSNTDFIDSTLDENIRQQKNNDQQSTNYTLNLRYEEPLTKGVNLNFDFNTNSNNSSSNNNTYDIFQDGGNLSDSLNPLYSNNFRAKNLQTRFNTALVVQTKKTLFSLGGNISQLNWNQNDLTNNLSIRRKYLNILPTAKLRINLNKRSIFSVDFKSQTTQPQITQIQPVTNNNDPLHISLGNPDLTQAYVYNLSLNYSNLKPSKNSYFNTYASLSYTQHAISLRQYYIDAKQVSQYYNSDGNFNSNIFVNYNRKLTSKMQVVLSGNMSLSQNKNMLNNEENSTIEQHYRSNSTFIYTIDTLLNVTYSFIFDYSLSHSSLVNTTSSKIWNTLQNLDIIYHLPKGLSIASRFNWTLRPKISPQDQSYSIFLWNVSLAKPLDKKEAFTVKLFIYDLLNQNKSNSIYYGPNIQSDRTTTTIGRYVMLGVVWNFTHRKHI